MDPWKPVAVQTHAVLNCYMALVAVAWRHVQYDKACILCSTAQVYTCSPTACNLHCLEKRLWYVPRAQPRPQSRQPNSLTWRSLLSPLLLLQFHWNRAWSEYGSGRAVTQSERLLLQNKPETLPTQLRRDQVATSTAHHLAQVASDSVPQTHPSAALLAQAEPVSKHEPSPRARHPDFTCPQPPASHSAALSASACSLTPRATQPQRHQQPPPPRCAHYPSPALLTPAGCRPRRRPRAAAQRS